MKLETSLKKGPSAGERGEERCGRPLKSRNYQLR